MRFHIYSIQGTFVLVSPQLPHWRCTGFSREDVMRDCACSLRSYVRNVSSITPNEATSIAEALTLRMASQYDAPIKWV
jgi:hypothetical protein